MKNAHDAIVHREQADYLDRLLSPRDALLARMEARARERGYPISDPEVGRFLEITASARAPQLIVELGTNIGYGAIVLARGAGPSARVITAETNAALAAEARGFIDDAGLSSQIDVREQPAIDLLLSLARDGARVDLAYIDCVKEEYVRYLELLVPLLGERGVLIADNVLWSGHVARAEVPDSERARTVALRAFNDALVLDTRLRAVLLPLGDGVALASRV